MRDGRLDQGHQLRLVTGKAARHEAGPQLQRQVDQINGSKGIDGAGLVPGIQVCGCRVLALGQAVATIVLGDVEHVQVAPHHMGKLPQPDGGRISVAGHTQVDQIAIGQIGAGGDRGHAPVHRVEAVRLTQKVGRRLGRAAYSGDLGDAVRLDGQLETGLDDGRTDRVVTAAGAQG